jgi:hypothetical protein
MNVSRSTIRVYPLGVNSVTAGSTLQIQLPSNSQVLLNTFAIHALGSTTGTGGTASVAFPANIECMIDQITCEANGQMLDAGCTNTSTLMKMAIDLHLGSTNNFSKRCVLQNGDLITQGLVTGGALVASTVQTNTPYVFSNWLGILQAQPEVWDTGLVGDTRLSFRFSPNTALLAANATNPAYMFSSLYSTMDVISIDDGLYNQMVAQMLAQRPIPIVFPRYLSFTNGSTNLSQSTRCSLSTKSLDMLIGTFLDPNYQTQTLDTVVNSSIYQKRNASGLATSQFQLNSVYSPTWPATPEHVFYTSLTHWGDVLRDGCTGITPYCNSLSNFLAGFFMHVERFDLDKDPGSRVLSGIDTMGSSANLFWTSTGTGTGFAWVYAKCTSQVLVGAYRNLEIIG